MLQNCKTPKYLFSKKVESRIHFPSLAMHICMFLVCPLMCATLYSTVCVIHHFDVLYDFLSI